MIAFLDGIVTAKEPVNVVIDCNGVGYFVHIPLSTFDKLPDNGKKARLFIHYSFNESDGVRLFGFFSKEERDVFRQLISISKIGPKLALAILSGLSVQDFIRAIQAGDIGLIATIPGIGKKSAERLIIELKDKVGSIADLSDLMSTSGDKDIVMEAETALVTLGYRQFEVRKSIAVLLKENDFKTSEEIIKAAIKALYKKSKI
ncbi:MAG TPA: Holliday junction branch migration protein RuvA [Candidatus Cloacimonadota bacterium]|nr:Holliday junction branch migration protein RuvA [Candidatus Cloacimonadota bacterium]